MGLLYCYYWGKDRLMIVEQRENSRINCHKQEEKKKTNLLNFDTRPRIYCTETRTISGVGTPADPRDNEELAHAA